MNKELKIGFLNRENKIWLISTAAVFVLLVIIVLWFIIFRCSLPAQAAEINKIALACEHELALLAVRTSENEQPMAFTAVVAQAASQHGLSTADACEHELALLANRTLRNNQESKN